LKRKNKVPVILQMEASECGAASLTMILGYYRRYIPLEKMRIECNVMRDGSSAKYIIKAAVRQGLVAKGFKMSPEQIKKRSDFPMIIHWNFNHFVVLCGFNKKGAAIINDPAAGSVTIDEETFDKSFTGIALTFQPGEDFEPCGSPKSSGNYIVQRLSGTRVAVFCAVVLGIIYSLIQLLPPVFYKIFTDKILLGKEAQWAAPLFYAMGAACIAGLLTGCVKNRILAVLRAKFEIRSVSSFVWKVLRLPVPFFDQRFGGDIVSRADSNQEIAMLLFGQMIPAIMDLFLIFCLFLLMLFLDVPMALVVFGIGIVQIVLILRLSAQNGDVARSIGRESGKVSGMMLSGISMIETVKSSGAERGMVEKILGYQTKYDNLALKLRKNRIYLGSLPSFLEGICNALILILGIYAIFQGRQTVGMLVAFQAFLQMFFSPLSSLTSCIQASQEISGSVDRIEDVMNYEGEITEQSLFGEDIGGRETLTGEVEMSHVSFGYSPVTEPLLQDFSLHARPGQMIAFSGGSGSGKSTLAKLLSGLYAPGSGEIYFDGQRIQDIDHYVFSDAVAVVDQSISLFAGTIWDNITMWDQDVDEKVVVQACKDACIHEDIMMRRDGYQYKISEGGSDFSGGQRQRIEIARAFASQPSILILDEATSALDVMTEKKIMDAVKRRNITCFIVAHRLSTIRDADEIIMIHHGKIQERGTHEELMEVDGAYAALVRL
jgi:NHLM bacteriocin system ABC transporter peptidase/ATP-binding protein